MINDAVRILMYSHDTFGLGHLTRTLRIARAIRDRSQRASILVLTGSPVAPYVALPQGSDLVKLPSVLKSGNERYRSRDLEVDFAQIRRMRKEVIRGTAQTFRPHIFMVDNVPLGMKGEIVPTLQLLKKAGTTIILNLRDILDSPSVIREVWTRDQVGDVLENLYDRIFVLGDQELFDATEAYSLPQDRTTHVGYATPLPYRYHTDPVSKRPEATRNEARVLVTAGGGGDGIDFMRPVLEGLRRASENGGLAPGKRLRIEVVSGPLMSDEDRRSLADHAVRANAEIEEFVTDMPRRMSECDLVIAMAGYNTCCEILSHARSALLFPRVEPRVEQLIRAEAFERRGIAGLLPPGSLDPALIAERVVRWLREEPAVSESGLPRIGGLERLADLLVSNLDHFGGNPNPEASGSRPAGRTGGEMQAFQFSRSQRPADEFGRIWRRGWSSRGGTLTR